MRQKRPKGNQTASRERRRDPNGPDRLVMGAPFLTNGLCDASSHLPWSTFFFYAPARTQHLRQRPPRPTPPPMSSPRIIVQSSSLSHKVSTSVCISAPTFGPGTPHSRERVRNTSSKNSIILRICAHVQCALLMSKIELPSSKSSVVRERIVSYSP